MSNPQPAMGDLRREGHSDLLLHAGIALAESLDMSETLLRVARLTMGGLADLCTIDLLQDDGSIRLMAHAAADPRLERELQDLRERHRLDPDGEHPVARVIASGEPALLHNERGFGMRQFALGSAHARFMGSAGYNSAIIAPLQARERTLGSLSVLRVGDGSPYDEHEVAVVCELARRAALAIDNSRLFSEVRAVERRLEAILSTMAEAITLVDEHGAVVFANQAAAELADVSCPEELMGMSPEQVTDAFILLDEHGNEVGAREVPRAPLGQDVRRPEPRTLRAVSRATGQERWLMARPARVTDPESGRLIYTVNVYEDITEVKRAQLAESFMAEASRVLASSMDYGETLARVARLAVPRIADWCAIDVLSEAGELQRVAVHHSSPERVRVAMQMDSGYPISRHERVGVAEVVRTGRAIIYESITPGMLAAYARDGEHLKLLQALGGSSMLIVPLAAPTGPVGAITLVSAESGRRLGQVDAALAERLGRRAGTAVESARLYTERARIADTLQAALLPESLPQIPGVQIHALYRAAGELNDVGGDFYDVFELGPGRWLMAIGDVCGKGPRAAGVTALARHTLRTAAMLGASTSGMLATLHEALRRQPQGADLCTVCLVTLEARGEHADLTVALAGHPNPLIIGEGGELTPIGTPGTLLGVLDPISISEVGATLKSGQTLLLYTDGVPEAGRDPDRPGLESMLDREPRVHARDLPALLGTIEERALAQAGGGLRDDIAMLALRLAAPAGGPA